MVDPNNDKMTTTHVMRNGNAQNAHGARTRAHDSHTGGRQTQTDTVVLHNPRSRKVAALQGGGIVPHRGGGTCGGTCGGRTAWRGQRGPYARALAIAGHAPCTPDTCTAAGVEPTWRPNTIRLRVVRHVARCSLVRNETLLPTRAALLSAPCALVPQRRPRATPSPSSPHGASFSRGTTRHT